MNPRTQTITSTNHALGAHEQDVLGPGLFLVLECERPTAGSLGVRLPGLERVTVGRSDQRAAGVEERTVRLGVPDRFLSSLHAELVATERGWQVRDLASRNGVFVNGMRVAEVPLEDGDVIELGHSLWLFKEDQRWPGDSPCVMEAGAGEDLLCTVQPAVAFTQRALSLASRGGLSVLLLGETGTGKEVAARAVHALSGRSGAFVPVNCAALPPGVMEGQLFGHTRGAFTGAARDEVGLVRASHGGTLFLDEIGDLPLPAQAALLRVLQEREVLPVGATRPVPVDLRVVGATHRRLEQLPGKGEFRAEPYARLNGYTHLLAPLRDRMVDLGALVARLLPPPPAGVSWTIHLEAGRALIRHRWPHNIRELQQALGVAATLATDGLIRREHLPDAVRTPVSPSLPAPPKAPLPRGATNGGSVEPLRQELVDLLTRHHGNVSMVAKDMGKARMQIHRWMRRLNIDPEQYRT